MVRIGYTVELNGEIKSKAIPEGLLKNAPNKIELIRRFYEDLGYKVGSIKRS